MNKPENVPRTRTSPILSDVVHDVQREGPFEENNCNQLRIPQIRQELQVVATSYDALDLVTEHGGTHYSFLNFGRVPRQGPGRPRMYLNPIFTRQRGKYELHDAIRNQHL